MQNLRDQEAPGQKGAYRRDIDGLRAIAIIPVVLFHVQVPYVTGGFVGVDVFFVVSGYLITTLLLTDLREGRFSIASFYERRARRIVPALAVVLLGTALAAQLLFLPDDATRFGKSLLATVFFSSNMWFWRQTGYFQAPAENEPLLHTWSLSVEEQFYIAFPLFLFCIHRYFRQRYAVAIGAVLIASFALAVWAAGARQSAGFYLAPPRAWELLVGAFLALGVLPVLRDRVTASVLGLLGLAAIAYAVFAFSRTTPFPGANTLYPALGTALVIYSGASGESLVAWLLGARPLVFVGLISYSLYLWHWVALVLTRYYVLPRAHPIELGLAVAISVVLAILSWRYVERPFRGRHGIGTRRSIFAGTATIGTVLVAYALWGFVKPLATNRFSPRVMSMLDAKGDFWPRRDECVTRICRVGSTTVPPTFMLWGDSHAGAIAPAIERAALDDTVSGFISVNSGCVPLVHVQRFDLDESCPRFADSVLAMIDRQHVTTVLLHARWALYTEVTLYRGEPGGTPVLSEGKGPAANYPMVERELDATLDELRRRHLRIVIIASVPEVGLNVPTVLARTAQSHSSYSPAPPYAEFTERQKRVFSMLNRAATEFGATVVYPHEAFCDQMNCAVFRDGHPLYWDDDHLSVHGAMYLRPMFDRLLARNVIAGH